VIASDQPPVQGTAWDGRARRLRLRFLIPATAIEREQSENLSAGRGCRPVPGASRPGAYPGAITADTITFYGIFKKTSVAFNGRRCGAIFPVGT